MPPVLYKYYAPERFHVLTDCYVRFSQRAVFEDYRELQPEVAAFGTGDEIRTFCDANPQMREYPELLREAVIHRLLNQPGEQDRFVRLVQASMVSPNEFGVFCLSEDPNSEQMWNDYADHGRGFVAAFDTTYRAFSGLRQPGRLGRVEYSDEPLGTFLGSYGGGAFFRKRNRYRFEAEWRSVRPLQLLERTGVGSPAIYVSPFNPECLVEILIRPECTVEWQLRHLAAIDARYRHTRVRLVPS